MQPLSGIRVIDFSTLVPGPLATLMLAQAGAEVIKIERPGGDDMRNYPAWPDDGGAIFALLNNGKRSVEIDLKADSDRAAVMAMIESADVLVEQFRPGVMRRLGLDYETLAGRNPGLVYCSITGYGQTGPGAGRAGHDLNYLAETGLLHLTALPELRPMPPEALIADIAGGAYPAVINILLALRDRDTSGKGCHLDVSMTANLFPLAFPAFGQRIGSGRWPEPGRGPFTGGSPRYQLYRTADDRLVAVAALEDRFWRQFCALIDLDPALRDDSRDRAATLDAVAAILRSRSADSWREHFGAHDVCCSIVDPLDRALRGPQHAALSALVGEAAAGREPAPPVLPTAIDQRFQGRAPEPAPALGEANGEFGFPPRRT